MKYTKMKIARAKRAKLLSFFFSLKSCIDATFFSPSSSWLLELSTVSGDGWSHECMHACKAKNAMIVCILV